MKFQHFILAASILSIAACKTPYKATDTPINSADSTANRTDSSSTSAHNMDNSSMRTTPMQSDTSSQTPSTDSTNRNRDMNMPRTDSSNQSQDSSMAKPDTTRSMNTTDSTMRGRTDSSMSSRDANTPANVSDSSSNSSTANTTGMEKSAANSEAPDVVAPAFSKQYPNASKVEWSAYDSLAAVPIDMRLTGWKRMHPEDHFVKFENNGETYYAWYDSKGKWVGSASPLEDVNKLPAAVKTAVNNAIKTRYAGYQVSQVNREFQTGKKSYEVELTKDNNKVRMMVSSTGKIGQIYRYKTDK